MTLDSKFQFRYLMVHVISSKGSISKPRFNVEMFLVDHTWFDAKNLK
jgi:hypothetical protein